MRRLRLPALIGALAMAVACGGGAETEVTSQPADDSSSSAEQGATSPEAGTASPGGASTTPSAGGSTGAGAAAGDGQALPRVEVLDVGSGDKVQLASLGDAGKPLLLWFWAPH